jgi:hypothetical protein
MRRPAAESALPNSPLSRAEQVKPVTRKGASLHYAKVIVLNLALP